VRPEQPAKVKLAAYSFQKYGMVDGQVRHVSADASDRQRGADDGASGPSSDRSLAYRTVIDLKSQVLKADGVTHPLRPGMQVSAEIKLGTRTVLEYLLSPVTKAFTEAGRER
jgi:HlyD family secretion protein